MRNPSAEPPAHACEIVASRVVPVEIVRADVEVHDRVAKERIGGAQPLLGVLPQHRPLGLGRLGAVIGQARDRATGQRRLALKRVARSGCRHRRRWTARARRRRPGRPARVWRNHQRNGPATTREPADASGGARRSRIGASDARLGESERVHSLNGGYQITKSRTRTACLDKIGPRQARRDVRWVRRTPACGQHKAIREAQDGRRGATRSSIKRPMPVRGGDNRHQRHAHSHGAVPLRRLPARNRHRPHFECDFPRSRTSPSPARPRASP